MTMHIDTQFIDEEQVLWLVKCYYSWHRGYPETQDEPAEMAVIEIEKVERRLDTYPAVWTGWWPPGDFEDELYKQCWEDFNR